MNWYTLAAYDPYDPYDPLRAEVDAFEQRVKTELGLQEFTLSFLGDGDLRLCNLIVPREKRKQGVGSEAMRRLTEFADQHGLRLLLSPGIRDSYQGTTSRSRLVSFYRRFGFVPNKGRKIDYRISDGMWRKPIPPIQRQASREPKVYRFDFDQTLCRPDPHSMYDTYDYTLEANQKMVQLLKQYAAQGDKVGIVTARGKQDAAEVYEFVQKYELPVSFVEFTNFAPKSAYLRRHGVTEHYDDDERVHEDCRRAGIKSVPVVWDVE